MLNRWTKTPRSAKGKTSLVLLGVLGVFGSGADAVYAMDEAEDNPRVATPWITAKHGKRTWQTWATFGYTDGWHGASFQCSLDGLAHSNVSSAAPVELQAHGSITLPAQGRPAPTIQLLNLPVNQDACQSARFPLSFTGSAHS